MKVLFLIQHPNMPSSRARVLDLLPYLPKEGIEFKVKTYPKSLIRRLQLLQSAKYFDIVYLQKKMPSPFDAILLRKVANRLVFDFDDAIMYKHDIYGGHMSRTRHYKFRNIVKKADLVVAGNMVLAKYALEHNKNVVVIPTGVPVNVPLRNHDERKEGVKIGWIGGNINLIYLKMLAPILQKLAEHVPFKLVVISGIKPEMPGIDMEFIPWSLQGQYVNLSQLDIGIMPLPKTAHAEGKCGYKALQYMTVGIPPVCSKVGDVEKIIEHKKEGILVESLEGFLDSLLTLIRNPSLRKELGQRARQKVIGHYSLEVIAKRLIRSLKENL